MRYYSIQIGDVFLTSNAAEGGPACKTQVLGLSPLKTTKTGQVITAADGTPYAQLVNSQHKGLRIEIQVEWMSKSVFDQVVEIIENCKEEPESVTIHIIGDTGDFEFGAMPLVPDDIVFQEFRNNIVKGVTFRFITV